MLKFIGRETDVTTEFDNYSQQRIFFDAKEFEKWLRKSELGIAKTVIGVELTESDEDV